MCKSSQKLFENIIHREKKTWEVSHWNVKIKMNVSLGSKYEI